LYTFGLPSPCWPRPHAVVPRKVLDYQAVCPAPVRRAMKTNGCALAGGEMMSAATLMASPTAALAQQQVDWCVNASHQFSLNQQISGCTAAIESGSWSGIFWGLALRLGTRIPPGATNAPGSSLGFWRQSDAEVEGAGGLPSI
jgi:hypothetical protein